MALVASLSYGEYLVVSRDTFGCHNFRGVVLVSSGYAGKHPTAHRTAHHDEE